MSKGEKSFLTRLSEYSALKLGLIVLFVGIIERIVLSLLFMNRFGFHSSNGIEIWWFYGIAEGVFKTNAYDPTQWILSSLDLLPFDLYHLVVAAGIVLMSFIGVLIFLITTELHEKKTGFLAGILYVSMVQPLTISTVGFVHDFVQIPIILLVVLAVLYTLRKKELWVRAISALSIFFFLWLGFQVSKSVLVGLPLVGVFLLWQILDYLIKKTEIDRTLAYLAFLVIFTSVSLVVAFKFLPGIMENVFGNLPQGRMGSVDVKPLSLHGFWMRYNMLLFLLLPGFYAILRNKDSMTYSFLLSGFILSLFVDRGSRFLDIGLALMVAQAATYWKEDLELKIKDSLHRLQFSRENLALTTLAAVSSLIVLLAFFLKVKVHPFYTLVITLGFIAIFLYLVASHLLELDRSMVVLIIALSCFLLGVVYVHNPGLRAITGEGEYQALKMIDQMEPENSKSKILSSWDHGHFAKAITGLEPVSDPGSIDKEMQNIMWYPEKLSSLYLKKNDIEYVLVTNQVFNIRSGKNIGYEVGGLVFDPEKSPNKKNLPYITAFKLRYPQKRDKLNHFTPIYNHTGAGIQVYLYKVNRSLTEHEKQVNSYVDAVVENHGEPVLANLQVMLVEKNFLLDSININKSFEKKEVKEVVVPLNLSDEATLANLSARVKPTPLDEKPGVRSKIQYLNKYDERIRANITLKAVDSQTGQVIRNESYELTFKPQKTRTINFTFQRPSHDHSYEIKERILPESSAEHLEIVNVAKKVYELETLYSTVTGQK